MIARPRRKALLDLRSRVDRLALETDAYQVGVGGSELLRDIETWMRTNIPQGDLDRSAVESSLLREAERLMRRVNLLLTPAAQRAAIERARPVVRRVRNLILEKGRRLTFPEIFRDDEVRQLMGIESDDWNTEPRAKTLRNYLSKHGLTGARGRPRKSMKDR